MRFHRTYALVAAFGLAVMACGSGDGASAPPSVTNSSTTDASETTSTSAVGPSSTAGSSTTALSPSNTAAATPTSPLPAEPPRFTISFPEAVPGETSVVECCISDPSQRGERSWTWAVGGDPERGLVVAHWIVGRPGASPEGDFATSLLDVVQGSAWLAIPHGLDGAPADSGFIVFWSRANDDVWLFQSYGISSDALVTLATNATADARGELTLEDAEYTLIASGAAEGGRVHRQVFVIDDVSVQVAVADTGDAFDGIISSDRIRTIDVAGTTGYIARHATGQTDVVWQAIGPWWASLSLHSALEPYAEAIIDSVEPRPSGWTEPPLDSLIDLLDHWPAPPVWTPALDDAPTMLPDGLPMDGSAIRREAVWGSDLKDYLQIWADDSTGQVLMIRSDIAQGTSSNGEAFDIAPWDRAFAPAMAPGYASVTLVDPSGSVLVWARGIEQQEVLDIARSIRLRGYAGWGVKALPEGMNLLTDEWVQGVASRSITWAGNELNIATGTRESLLPPWGPAKFTLVDVNGSTGVAVEDETGRSAITWPVGLQTTIQLGHMGSLAEALAIARGVHWVDEATWNSATRLDSGDDGCQSLFFC